MMLGMSHEDLHLAKDLKDCGVNSNDTLTLILRAPLTQKRLKRAYRILKKSGVLGPGFDIVFQACTEDEFRENVRIGSRIECRIQAFVREFAENGKGVDEIVASFRKALESHLDIEDAGCKFHGAK